MLGLGLASGDGSARVRVAIRARVAIICAEHLGLLVSVRLVYGGAELLPSAVTGAAGAVE